MYEPRAHALLNEFLDALRAETRRADLRHFHTRLGANFYAIHSLFTELYGHRPDCGRALFELVQAMTDATIERRPELEARDRAREAVHDWFLHQSWVGMALYVDGFAGDLQGVEANLDHLERLGVNLLHLMPLCRCPEGASDGGYAVSDFRQVDPRLGTLEDLRRLADTLRARGTLLTLDVVLNHTSDEHEWARRARAGEARYRDYYFTFEDRVVPDQFESGMPEIFPETAPGNFTWDEALGRWVMTVFNRYQWDLNYQNPAVLVEMLRVILFWANQGADVLRLDAVAFLWKRIGTTCQNQREAHLILQLLKDCCQVVAPGVLFIAEAIVAPVEIIKYFGEDAVIAKECEIAYNATLMALLWDATATHNAKLLRVGLRNLPDKLEHATWLNYVRCHDDIGLGFTDADIAQTGYDPQAHRRFLLDYLTGGFPGSLARGVRFGENMRTGDARIAGSLASLIGLERALELGDEDAITEAIDRILLLHAVVLSFGGIPLLYYGDELGTLNDDSYRDDPHKSDDSRWIHRPRISPEDRARVDAPGSPAARIFAGLKHLIAVRKRVDAFADYNNRDLLDVGNDHLLAYRRCPPLDPQGGVWVVANFSASPQTCPLRALQTSHPPDALADLIDSEPAPLNGGTLTVAPYRCLWLRATGTAGSSR